MLGNGHHVARAGIMKELCPGVGIEVLRGELGNQILVAELRFRTVGGNVMREIRRAMLVHVARVPLAAKAGDGVDTPVNEDAELRIAKPLRRLVGAQALPIIAKWASGDGAVNIGENALPLRIVL